MAYLKPELSTKNKYWLPKHRYYELRHFCLQYPDWKNLYSRLEFKMTGNPEVQTRGRTPGDPTGQLASMRADCARNIDLVERTAKAADETLAKWILKAVTEDIPFTALNLLNEIPCGKDMFYDRFRRFYWLLSQEKGL